MSGYYGDLQREIKEEPITDNHEESINNSDEEHYVCENCGSDKICGRAWVDYNTREFNIWEDDADIYCENCADLVFVIESKYYEALHGKLPVGSIVKLRDDSEYAGDGDSNPLDCTGIVITSDQGDGPYTVAWSNGTTNYYDRNDLILGSYAEKNGL